jgi:hypothetical protein
MRLQIALRGGGGKPGTVELDQPALYWDTRLHLTLLAALDEFRQFRQHLISSQVETPVKSSSNSTVSWILTLKGKTIICATLSPKHTVQLQAGWFYFYIYINSGLRKFFF